MSQEATKPVPPVTQTNPVPSNKDGTVSSATGSFLSPPPPPPLLLLLLLLSSSSSSLTISLCLFLSLLVCGNLSKGFLNNGTYVIYSLTPIRVTCSPFCPLLSLLQFLFYYIRYNQMLTFYRSFM